MAAQKADACLNSVRAIQDNAAIAVVQGNENPCENGVAPVLVPTIPVWGVTSQQVVEAVLAVLVEPGPEVPFFTAGNGVVEVEHGAEPVVFDQ